MSVKEIPPSHLSVKSKTSLYNIITPLLMMAFLALIILTTQLALTNIQNQYRTNMESALKTVLLMTQEAMYLWFEHQGNLIETYAKSKTVVEFTLSQLLIDNSVDQGKQKKQLENIRHYFSPLLKQFGDQDFFIIDRQGNLMASSRDNFLNTANTLAANFPDIFENVMRGQTRLTPMMKTKDFLTTSTLAHSTLFILTPIRGDSEKIIAALAISLDPRVNFSHITQLGRIGKTGETYALSKEGIMLTHSRFEHQLRQIGLISPDDAQYFQILLTDPGGNLLEGYVPNAPNEALNLTKMAQRATSGNSGSDVLGYRDYRGVKVYGAWLWDQALNLGLTTEIDEAEVLQPFYVTRSILIALVAFTTVLSFSMILLFIAFRRQQKLKLEKTQLELENKVQHRTQNLEKARNELHRANCELQILASLDALTGTANRRGLDDFLRTQWIRCQNENLLLSFIMIDIDSFKQLNDTYGHQQGDECLITISNILKTNPQVMQSDGLVARYGGEEFAIVLTNIETPEAVFIVQSIFKTIEKRAIPNQFSIVSNKTIVSVSAGIATFLPDEKSTPKTIISAADHALYIAKQRGRNRIEVFESTNERGDCAQRH